jgi:hypothetical protein
MGVRKSEGAMIIADVFLEDAAVRSRISLFPRVAVHDLAERL